MISKHGNCLNPLLFCDPEKLLSGDYNVAITTTQPVEERPGHACCAQESDRAIWQNLLSNGTIGVRCYRSPTGPFRDGSVIGAPLTTPFMVC